MGGWCRRWLSITVFAAGDGESVSEGPWLAETGAVRDGAGQGGAVGGGQLAGGWRKGGSPPGESGGKGLCCCFSFVQSRCSRGMG